MRQELVDAASPVRGQPREHILEIGMWVMPVHLRRLDQAHDGGRPLARARAAGKQPAIAADGNRTDLVLDPIVVHGQFPVVRESGQRHPAPPSAKGCSPAPWPSGYLAPF